MIKPILCPNLSCSSHTTHKNEVIKLGKIYLKSSRTYNQRYKCKACKKTFCNSMFTNKVFKEKHFELRQKIQNLYCSGNTLRDIAKNLKISKTTVEAKMVLLANESIKYHQLSGEFLYENVKYKDTKNIRTPLVVYDEMETHEATVLKPISIGIAYDYHNKKIVAIETAPFRPRGRYKELLDKKPDLAKKYGSGKAKSRDDTREAMTLKVLGQVRDYLSTSPYAPTIITDGKNNYGGCISAVFGTDVEHIVIYSRGDKTIDDLEPTTILDETGLIKDPEELRPKEMLTIMSKTSKKDYKQHRAISAMATFNKLCATLRLKIAVLARSSFVHTQKIEKLQGGLYVFQHKWNKEHKSKVI